jgi:hypothetical protein
MSICQFTHDDECDSAGDKAIKIDNTIGASLFMRHNIAIFLFKIKLYVSKRALRAG